MNANTGEGSKENDEDAKFTRIMENVNFKLYFNLKPANYSNSQDPLLNTSSIAASFTQTDALSTTSTCTTYIEFSSKVLKFNQTLYNQLCFFGPNTQH